MKKDKKWLKEKADRLFFDNSISNNPYLVAKREAITEISNLIDQLDEPEVLSEEWIERNTSPVDNEGRLYIWKRDLQNLLVPKQYKPVIPKFVADWTERQKQPDWDYENKEDTSADSIHSSRYSLELNYWKLIDRVMHDYEEEKEKKYQVIIRDGEYIRLFLCKHGDNVIIGTNDNYIEKCLEVTYLTEQEIKDYDERFWLFAVKVEELEE